MSLRTDTIAPAVDLQLPDGANRTTRARQTWAPAIGGVLAGIIAAGAAGTSTKTIYLGAVWAGAAAGLLLVVAITEFAVSHLRRSVPAGVLRRYRAQMFRHTVSWSLGGFALWFLIVQPLLRQAAGIEVPMLGA